MQPQAWYFATPRGLTYGPCYTRWQAEVEAGRRAAKRPKLEAETAHIIWRSLSKLGWKVGHTHTKLIRAESISEVIYGERSILTRWSEITNEQVQVKPTDMAPVRTEGGAQIEPELEAERGRRTFLAALFTCWGSACIFTDYWNDQPPVSLGVIALIGLYQGAKWTRFRNRRMGS